MRIWFNGRTSPCQGENCGFKSRYPLYILPCFLNLNVFTKKFMSLTLSRQFPSLLYIGNSPFSGQQPWPTKRLHPRNWRRFKRTTRQSSLLLGKSFQKRTMRTALLSSVFRKGLMSYLTTVKPMQSTVLAPVVTSSSQYSLLQMQNMWEKRLWFLHNALPLAAMLRTWKPNMLYGIQNRAALPLQIWVGQRGIQFLQKVAKKSLHFSYTNKKSHVWNYLIALESHAPIFLTKVGWVSRPNEGRSCTKHSLIQINGFLNSSAWYVLRPADMLQNKYGVSKFWMTKYNHISFYFPKTFFFNSYIKLRIKYYLYWVQSTAQCSVD